MGIRYIDNETDIKPSKPSRIRYVDEQAEEPMTVGGIKQIAGEAGKQVLNTIVPQNQVKALTTSEARGVGQGAVQGITGGYGMPTARSGADIISMLMGKAGASNEIPKPTTKESIVGNMLSAPSMVGGIGMLPKMGKMGQVLSSAAAGYSMNPSDDKIVSPTDPSRGLGAAMGGAVGVGGALLGAVADSVVPRGADALKRAIKPSTNNTNFDRDAKRALPVIQEHIKETGSKINNLEDFWNSVKDAKNKIWGKVNSSIDSTGGKIDMSGVKREINKSIPQYTIDNEAAKANKIMKFADNYKKELTPQEVEHYLERVNKDLAGYYQMSPGDRYKAMSNEELIAKVSESNALRDALYTHLERAGSPGVAELKKTLGALMNIGNVTGKRINVAGRQQPISLQEAINYAGAAHDLLIGHTGAGLARAAISKIVKNANNADNLVKRAVSTYGAPPSQTGKYAGAIGAMFGRTSAEVGK